MRPTLVLMLLPIAPLLQAGVAGPAPVARVERQDATLLEFLDRAYDEQVSSSPETQTQLGLKTNNDRLDDYTDAAAIRRRDLGERQLKAMRAQFRPEQLSESTRVSYRLFEYEVERARESFRFRKLRFRCPRMAARRARSRRCSSTTTRSIRSRTPKPISRGCAMQSV